MIRAQVASTATGSSPKTRTPQGFDDALNRPVPFHADDAVHDRKIRAARRH